jgi:pantoate--beta-alanine ligase
MIVFKKVKSLQKTIDLYKKSGLKIAFVPTMGALHEGHLSLISQAKKKCDVVICSIFVNPTQFNNADDLKKYPRTFAADKKLLATANTDILFAPEVIEIYPENLDTSVNIDLKKLDKVMEGKFRPGHFRGMLQVVKRLLDITTPDYLYMGQKDFQQFSIVSHMIKTLNLPVKLVVGKTLREKDGLAMSSRNVRLTEYYRSKASMIYKTMKWVKKNKHNFSITVLKKTALNNLKIADLKPEYFEIINGHTLSPIKTIDEKKYNVICTAAWAGDVRLIDNLIL